MALVQVSVALRTICQAWRLTGSYWPRLGEARRRRRRRRLVEVILRWEEFLGWLLVFQKYGNMYTYIY